MTELSENRPVTRRPARSPRSISNLAERFGLIGVWVIVIIIFGLLRPNRVPNREQFLVDFRVTGRARRAHARADHSDDHG